MYNACPLQGLENGKITETLERRKRLSEATKDNTESMKDSEKIGIKTQEAIMVHTNRGLALLKIPARNIVESVPADASGSSSLV